MVHDSHGKHHFFKRKIKLSKKELNKVADNAVYVAGFFGLIMTLPQIFKIWFEKNASGVSIISWMSYTIVGLIWIGYGFVHKEKPIILTYSLWIAFYSFIIIGTFIYG
jgi:uncharacterized protein with PQ loop repeat